MSDEWLARGEPRAADPPVVLVEGSEPHVEGGVPADWDLMRMRMRMWMLMCMLMCMVMCVLMYIRTCMLKCRSTDRGCACRRA